MESGLFFASGTAANRSALRAHLDVMAREDLTVPEFTRTRFIFFAYKHARDDSYSMSCPLLPLRFTPPAVSGMPCC